MILLRHIDIVNLLLLTVVEVVDDYCGLIRSDQIRHRAVLVEDVEHRG